MTESREEEKINLGLPLNIIKMIFSASAQAEA
jgi:hypothetical protein